MTRKITVFVVALLLACMFSVSSAWSHDFINSTQGYDAGVWFTSLYGNVKYGQELSLRGDLDLKQATGFVADGEWKFNDKWAISVNYAYMETTGDKAIGRNLNFNNRPIVRGDRLYSKLNLSTVNFLVHYNIYRTEDSTLNVAAGARYMDISLNIRKDASIVPGFDFKLSPTASFIPSIGLSGKQRITERIYAYGDFTGIFDVGSGDIKNANQYDFKGGLRWNFQELGWYATCEYRAFGTRISRTNDNSANFYWNGPAFTVRYEF